MIQGSVGRVCECGLADGSGCSNADVTNMMQQGSLFVEHVTHPTTHKSLYTTTPVPLGCCSHVAQLEHVMPPNTVYRNCHRLQIRETAPTLPNDAELQSVADGHMHAAGTGNNM